MESAASASICWALGSVTSCKRNHLLIFASGCCVTQSGGGGSAAIAMLHVKASNRPALMARNETIDIPRSLRPQS